MAIAYLMNNFCSHRIQEALVSWIEGRGKQKILPYLANKIQGKKAILSVLLHRKKVSILDIEEPPSHK
jgi:predicted solute-binding protein